MKKSMGLFIISCLIFQAFIQEKGITIFLVGDSTMADKPYKNGNPEKGWGQVFPLYFDEGVLVENHAVNGRSSKSFRDEGRWEIIHKRIHSGDYVIIQFGHNDEKVQDTTRYAAPDTDYRRNLINYVEETLEKGGKPILATPIVRRRFDEKSTFYDTHGEYPGVVKEVAAMKDVPLLDLHKRSMELVKSYGEDRSKNLFLHIEPGEYPSLSDGVEDNTHLSAVGAFRVCDLAIEEIRDQVPQLVNFLKD